MKARELIAARLFFYVVVWAAVVMSVDPPRDRGGHAHI